MSIKSIIFEDFMCFAKKHKIYFAAGACILVMAVFFVYRSNRPDSLEGMIKKADYEAEHGQIAYAAEGYIKIVKVFPKNYDAHIRLAELYLRVGEKDMAKVEYVKASRLGYTNKYSADTALANIYAKENNYNFGEIFIEKIKDSKIKKAGEEIGDFYYNWGLSFKDENKSETLRKFKTAYEHYKNAKSKKSKKTLNDINDIYITMADNLLEENKTEDAVNILKLSLNFQNNAETRYKLAKIYENEEKSDAALAEYKEAFNLNPQIASKDSYVRLLIKKAEAAKMKGDKVSAELHYTLAKNLNTEADIPINSESRIILNILSAKCNEDIEKDILIPEIKFRLRNISKDKITDIKIKTVFLKNGKPFSEKINIIATETNPLNSDANTEEIDIISSKPVKYVFDNHNLTAQIYISQEKNYEWTLFRKIRILAGNQSDNSVIRIKL